MANTLTLGKTVSCNGKTCQDSPGQTATGLQAILEDLQLPVAKVGQLTTRTDGTHGILTMAAGHGFTTGVLIDLYWTVAGVQYVNRGALVGTVATNSVPFTLSAYGTGTLPSNMTNVTAQIPTDIACSFVGASVTGIGFGGDSANSCLSFQSDSGGTEIYGRMQPLASAYGWVTGYGDPNPVTGSTMVQLAVSNGDSGKVSNIKVLVVTN